MAETEDLPVFHLEAVTYHYPDGEIGIHELDLTVHERERIVLLGANGSGKSTLLRVLDGLIFPGKGTVRAFGQVLNEKNLNVDRLNLDFRRRVGFVFQNSETQLFSSTVWDEIAFGPLHMGMSVPQIRERVSELLEFFGIEAIRDRPPFKLSGGEKKKVALAAVMATNPDVLLLDEPTAALDPRTERWLIDMLVQLGESGKTLITATHNLDIVEEISDRVVVFGENHRVAATGPPSELLSEKELLLRVNLIDPRFHKHFHNGDHRHYHIHD
ncbi:MAG: ABC transporter ATP-binding protein [Syntrophobacteraceae bacterium]|nr:ABC transporter ATP-binding protein [Syntrophobacteraceae bacterium]